MFWPFAGFLDFSFCTLDLLLDWWMKIWNKQCFNGGNVLDWFPLSFQTVLSFWSSTKFTQLMFDTSRPSASLQRTRPPSLLSSRSCATCWSGGLTVGSSSSSSLVLRPVLCLNLNSLFFSGFLYWTLTRMSSQEKSWVVNCDSNQSGNKENLRCFPAETHLIQTTGSPSESLQGLHSLDTPGPVHEVTTESVYLLVVI